MNILETLKKLTEVLKNGDVNDLKDVYSYFQFNLNDPYFNIDIANTDLWSFVQYFRYLPYLQDHINRENLTFSLKSTSDGLVFLELVNNIDERLALVFDKRGMITYTLTDGDKVDDDEKQVHILHGTISTSNLLSKSYKIQRVLVFINKVE